MPAVSSANKPHMVVNGQPCVLPAGADATTTLLHVLRNDLCLNGPKFGCGLGQCGACTVLVDGVAARACVIAATGVAGRHITTLEGLPNRLGRPGAQRGQGAEDRAGAALHPVQQAFVDAQAAQCGYCLNGMVMMAVALLERNPHPDDATIRAELSGNLCRCGTHVEIMRAVQRAAVLLHEAKA